MQALLFKAYDLMEREVDFEIKFLKIMQILAIGPDPC